MTASLPAPVPSFSELIRVFARIGVLSFGGPAGQIALMQHEIVDQRRWVDQGAFLRALNLCHLLPGPEAQQLATWIGWRLHGTVGGLATGLLFIVPGALVMLALSLLYAVAAGVGWFAALFLGIKAAVLAIIAQALWRIGQRALGTPFKLGLAAASLLLLLLAQVPFPVVILGAALAGATLGVRRPEWLGVQFVAADPVSLPPKRHMAARTARTVAISLMLWAAPMGLIAAALGPDHVLWDVGAFFSRLAVVSFGGAYAVLSYMAQAAVEQYQWLAAGEMADGLGLAETTPGPLILVTQFTGFLAAWRLPDPFSPWLAGLLGALLTTWVTFVPCFMWIFACAPWMDRLERAERLQMALAAITAAIVGVIANLALWFAFHVLFGGTPAVFDWRAGAIAVLAGVMLFSLRRGVIEVLAVSALAGLALTQV